MKINRFNDIGLSKFEEDVDDLFAKLQHISSDFYCSLNDEKSKQYWADEEYNINNIGRNFDINKCYKCVLFTLDMDLTMSYQDELGFESFDKIASLYNDIKETLLPYTKNYVFTQFDNRDDQIQFFMCSKEKEI